MQTDRQGHSQTEREADMLLKVATGTGWAYRSIGNEAEIQGCTVTQKGENSSGLEEEKCVTFETNDNEPCEVLVDNVYWGIFEPQKVPYRKNAHMVTYWKDNQCHRFVFGGQAYLLGENGQTLEAYHPVAG